MYYSYIYIGGILLQTYETHGFGKTGFE